MRASPQQTGLTACGALVAGRYGVIAAGQAAQLPAAVLADLRHLRPTTTGRLVRDAGGDWSRYAAQLARQLPTMTHASRS